MTRRDNYRHRALSGINDFSFRYKEKTIYTLDKSEKNSSCITSGRVKHLSLTY
ncbi:hypothetical protein ATN83_p20028 (plasmid) [Raoultella ornithinolytica]|nr:hypothetical protein ATN83_p20028 [Raoultella ornithinolytica]MDU5021850.1 hypothetical protein [Clostridiales bacterium]QCS39536.1 hypothetical protein [Klebsiella pneumoniae]UCZ50221.1 hypothetical protein [Klebsiella michiganensis]CCM84634.1 hypothetical protein BN426_4144 [Klebsiella pneumoniae subsp. pneumoniae ST258-K26BO]